MRKARVPNFPTLVLERLQSMHAGTLLTTQQLAEAFDTNQQTIGQRLAPLVESGQLVRSKVGNFAAYGLPEGTAPAVTADAGQLANLASWADGDVSFSGATVGDDGQVVLTRTQLLQLLAFVTRPHIAPSDLTAAALAGAATTPAQEPAHG